MLTGKRLTVQKCNSRLRVLKVALTLAESELKELELKLNKKSALQLSILTMHADNLIRKLALSEDKKEIDKLCGKIIELENEMEVERENNFNWEKYFSLIKGRDKILSTIEDVKEDLEYVKSLSKDKRTLSCASVSPTIRGKK